MSVHPAGAPVAKGGAARAAGAHGHAAGGTSGDVALVIKKRFAEGAGRAEFDRTTHAIGVGPVGEMVDVLFLSADDPHTPDDVFERLRWGGQVVIVSRERAEIAAAARAFDTWKIQPGERGAWVVEEWLGMEKKYWLRWLGLGTAVYFMVARKVMLIPPGKSSDRFTYNVYLERNRDAGGGRGGRGEYEVVKEVPTTERVLARLREKFPEADEELLRRRSRKFTEKIFPVFLTRETAMLKLLQRDLPAEYREKVPRVIAAEGDAQGLIRTLRMNWLRNGRSPVAGHGGDRGRALTQLEFARQSAELLAALHDRVGVMHLDLRLDNFVVTEHGVGFVDFGSAVRVGEEFPEASLLSNLFEEMMRTSQIQRMLGRMTEAKQVTSEEICNSYGRIDKAVDFFYLAVQINAPHGNPDFRGLVIHEPGSAEAKALAGLTAEILRPADPAHPRFRSAGEILRGIEVLSPES